MESIQPIHRKLTECWVSLEIQKHSNLFVHWVLSLKIEHLKTKDIHTPALFGVTLNQFNI